MALFKGSKKLGFNALYGCSKYGLSSQVKLNKNIDSNALEIISTKNAKSLPPFDNTLKFGSVTSDHMLTIDFDDTNGWHRPLISPYKSFEMDPACSVFHYALAAFEGCKAYIDSNNNIRTFRINKNMDRLYNSCEALIFPTFDKNEFKRCIEKLLIKDKRWIPNKDGFSLYIRPTIIGSNASLGVTRANEVKLYVITCPVGPYYPTGFAPVSLLASDKYVRAWPGGSGNAKLAANYGPTIRAQMEAASQGYQQIMWLFNKDGVDGKMDGSDDYVTEVGTMNQFFYWINKDGKKELITASLDGTILPGVTRDSILTLAREWNEFIVTEREYTMKEVIDAVNENRMIEAFGAGTAAIVSPVNNIGYRGKNYKIPCKDDKIGELTNRFFKTITDIQV